MEGLQKGCKTRDKIIQQQQKTVGTNEECLFIVLFQVCCVTSGVLYEDGTRRNFLSGYESSEWATATQCSNKLSRYRISFKPEGLYTHTGISNLSVFLLFLQPSCVSLSFSIWLSKCSTHAVLSPATIGRPISHKFYQQTIHAGASCHSGSVKQTSCIFSSADFVCWLQTSNRNTKFS